GHGDLLCPGTVTVADPVFIGTVKYKVIESKLNSTLFIPPSPVQTVNSSPIQSITVQSNKSIPTLIVHTDTHTSKVSISTHTLIMLEQRVVILAVVIIFAYNH